MTWITMVVWSHLEQDTLECNVQRALGSTNTNKACGGDGIPAELIEILKDDAMKVLHSVQLLSHVWLLATPQTAALQASLSITNSQSLPRLMSVMLTNHLILCHPLFLLPLIFTSIRVFSDESVLCIRWPKYWSFSFNISPSNEYSRLISFSID